MELDKKKSLVKKILFSCLVPLFICLILFCVNENKSDEDSLGIGACSSRSVKKFYSDSSCNNHDFTSNGKLNCYETYSSSSCVSVLGACSFYLLNSWEKESFYRTFYRGKTCREAGFPVSCSLGTFAVSAGDC